MASPFRVVTAVAHQCGVGSATVLITLPVAGGNLPERRCGRDRWPFPTTSSSRLPFDHTHSQSFLDLEMGVEDVPRVFYIRSTEKCPKAESTCTGIPYRFSMHAFYGF